MKACVSKAQRMICYSMAVILPDGLICRRRCAGTTKQECV
jgi:hypothetical protein